MDAIAKVTLDALQAYSGRAASRQYENAVRQALALETPALGDIEFLARYVAAASEDSFLSRILQGYLDSCANLSRACWRAAGPSGQIGPCTQNLLAQALEERRHDRAAELLFCDALSDLEQQRVARWPDEHWDSFRALHPDAGATAKGIEDRLKELACAHVDKILRRFELLMLHDVVRARLAGKGAVEPGSRFNQLIGDDTRRIACTRDVLETAMDSGYGNLIRLAMASKAARLNRSYRLELPSPVPSA
jgi:hypothetical protein